MAFVLAKGVEVRIIVNRKTQVESRTQPKFKSETDNFCNAILS